MKQKNIKGLISEYFIFLIFIALVVVLTCLKPSFIAPTNLVNIPQTGFHQRHSGVRHDVRHHRRRL